MTDEQVIDYRKTKAAFMYHYADSDDLSLGEMVGRLMKERDALAYGNRDGDSVEYNGEVIEIVDHRSFNWFPNEQTT